MNLIFILAISSFLVPCFVGKCTENANSNSTNSATIFNGSNSSQLNEMVECNGIHQKIIGNEENAGQQRYKRSGRRGSNGKGLTNIAGGRSIQNRRDTLFNNLLHRNAPFLRNSYNPMRVDRQLFPRANILNAPPINPALRLQMTPRRPIGQPSPPWAFSRALQQNVRKMESQKKFRQIDNRPRLRPPANDGMFVNPEYYQDRQISQRQELKRGLDSGELLFRLSASERRRYGLKYSGRVIPEPTLEPGQLVPQPIRLTKFRRLSIQPPPANIFGRLEEMDEGPSTSIGFGRRKQRSVNKFMPNQKLKRGKRKFG